MEDPYKIRFEQDRALREAARELVQQDMALISGDTERRGVATRIADRARSGASGAARQASDLASENSGAVATGLALAGAVLALALFRRPLLDTIREWIGVDLEAEQGGPALHSDKEQEYEGDM